MSKEVEKIRVEISKKYKEQINNLTDECDRLKALCKNLEHENKLLEEELSVKIHFINKLQDLLDMSDEDRDKYIDNLDKQNKANDAFVSVMSVLNRYM